MLEILNRICSSKGEPQDIDKLMALGSQIKDSSLCGLGQTAPNPVLSTLRYFRDEYELHIKEKRCPAGVCAGMFIYSVIPGKCTMCGVCFKKCPSNAINWQKKQIAEIIQDKCTKCGNCFNACKFDAIVKR